MPIIIDGQTYYRTREGCGMTGIGRSTLINPVTPNQGGPICRSPLFFLSKFAKWQKRSKDGVSLTST
jgi:hypothetical protein